MRHFGKTGRLVSLIVIAGMLNLGGLGAATAAMVATGDSTRVDRINRVQETLARDDIRRQLVDLGVSPDDAAARVSRLSNTELASLDGQLRQLPAGGDAVSLIVLVLLVLLFTDIMGYTDIFPFVKAKK